MRPWRHNENMRRSRSARTLLALIGFACSAGPVLAQEPASNSSLSFTSIERIRAALQTPPSDSARLFTPGKPDSLFIERLSEQPVIFRLGAVTFVTPTDGLFLDARVPIGDLLSRAVHSIAAAQHRRAEEAAHAEVLNALADFQKDQSESR